MFRYATFDSGHFDKRYYDVFKPAIEAANIEPYRVDLDFSVSIPIQEIENGIRNSAICFADITIDNPNVWYELGFAFAVKREVVLVYSDERKTKFPFDVQHRSIITYKTGDPQDFEELRQKITKRVQAILQKIAQSDVVKSEKKVLWNRLRAIIQGVTPAGFSKAVRELLHEIKRPSPIIRLWGNNRGLNPHDQEEFTKIGKEIGRCCAEAGLSLSCSMLNKNTLEYWALMGVSEAIKEGSRDISIYVHYHGPDLFYSDDGGEMLIKELPSIIKVKYPHCDTPFLDRINDEIAYERSSAHNARIGSLLQCDCVILVGGNDSAKHLIQLLAFIWEQRLSASKTPVFIPIPWVGGLGKKVFEKYEGVVEKIDLEEIGIAPP